MSKSRLLFPILDAHNDSIILREVRGDPMDFADCDPAYHVDLPRMRRGGMGSLFVMVGDSDVYQSLRMIDALYAMCKRHPGDFALCLTAADVRRANRAGQIGLVMSIEGQAMFAERLENLRNWHRLGIRIARITHLIAGETDLISIMATVACELHQTFPYFNWTGFYRVVAPDLLKIGPYQGDHGCLQISFDRGVCGSAARTRLTQLVPDVRQHPDHIACSSSTLSEIVVPIEDSRGELLAVLDVDSDQIDAFDEVDQRNLEAICSRIGSICPHFP